MNFYNEYNKLEHIYKTKPETERCFTELSILFSDLLIQLRNQVYMSTLKANK